EGSQQTTAVSLRSCGPRRLGPDGTLPHFADRSVGEKSCGRSRSFFFSQAAEELFDAGAADDARVHLEAKLRGVLHRDLTSDQAAETGGGLVEGGDGRVALLDTQLVDVDDGVTQVRRAVDTGDGHELEPLVGEPFALPGEHLAEVRVDPQHPITHSGSSSSVT